MNGSVLVVCPTRGRPAKAEKMAESFKATTNYRSKLLLLIDDDDPSDYSALIRSDICETAVRPRTDIVPMINRAIRERLHDYSFFGLMVDDGVFTTPGWDQFVALATPMGGVMSPAHNYGRHVDMPYVHRRWVERLGWYANERFKYWCWPTFTGILAQAAGRIVHAPKESFYIHHDDMGPGRWEDFKTEANVFYEECLWNLWPLVDKLNADD